MENKTFVIKTRALMEQSYIVKADTKEEAEIIALQNTLDITEQTQIDSGEILEVIEVDSNLYK